ncbi:hypothetical protein Sa4125_34040 [Aureimonas sp. SA4125]|uniref:VOC family protein n=1 Tax=Aureimonas sp. SA4125 TaxID=2826993 RepID=UPI001CC68792|nr:VOC family protein [Aureimonas sp. SA4125]BDA85862.1 hypothetical protein Sa4125_34040 [Aureimonas sp. SA4125]
MAKLIFLNLPVTDLARSIAFYRAIGAEQNHQFSDETGACMVLSDTIHLMLLTHPKYRQFTAKPIADTHVVSAALICLSEESRAAVDATVGWAGEAGGRADASPLQDHGWMYSRSFDDPDGHTFEIMWMDPAAAHAEAHAAA